MKSVGNNRKGFTLLEIAVVIAVLAVILSFGMTADLTNMRSDSFLVEQSKIVSTLEKARSRAMNNLFDTNHGVCYTPPNYIIFQGDTCVPGESVTANVNITTTFPSSPIIFDRLTGKTNTAVIHITDNTRSADITINNEGRIDW